MKTPNERHHLSEATVSLASALGASRTPTPCWCAGRRSCARTSPPCWSRCPMTRCSTSPSWKERAVPPKLVTDEEIVKRYQAGVSVRDIGAGTERIYRVLDQR